MAWEQSGHRLDCSREYKFIFSKKILVCMDK